MTLYQLLPSLSDTDYARLRADIAERGVLVPVEVDEHGEILDGHHRVRIAQELGVDYPTVVRPGMAEHEKRLHAVALNLARRHLTDAQKVLLGRTIEADVAEAMRGKMSAAGAKAAPGKPATSDTPFVPERTTDVTAAKVGLGSGRSYERAKSVIEKAEQHAPELVEQMAAGEISVKDAARELRQHAKAERVAAIAAVPVAALPQDRTYPVIYADPPWRYEHAPDDTRQIENHYPTMSLNEIAALDIPAAENAVLFLWATSPKLEEAMHVMTSWGFDYRTSLVWVKDKIGMGYYARQRHELLLVGRKGDLPVPDPSARPDSVITAPRGEHSAKPAVVYDLIEVMYPSFARVELFQRAAREGWDGWGNQAEAVA